MLRRLVKRGFEAAAFDPARTRPAGEAGAAEASSAAEVGRRGDTVGFEPEVYACLTGEEGALEGMNAGGRTAVRSNASVDGARIRPGTDLGVGFLDAPIAHGQRAEGILLALVGGVDGAVERSRPEPFAPSVWATSAASRSPG